MVRAPQPISLYFPFGLGDPWLHWLVSLPSKHSTSHLPLTSLDPSTSEDTSAPLISFLIGLERVLYPASLALALKKQLCRKTDQERLSSSPTFPPPRPALHADRNSNRSHRDPKTAFPGELWPPMSSPCPPWHLKGLQRLEGHPVLGWGAA